MTDSGPGQWLLLIPRIPAEPSRHRVAVWRRLRRLGAVPIASGAWALPDLTVSAEVVVALRAQALAGGGNLAVYAVIGAHQDDTAVLREAFTAARREEWAELVTDCGVFEAELERAIDTGESTFDHLEQHRWRMARLLRRQSELSQRNPFALPSAQQAADRLDAANVRLAHYAELVYRANAPDGAID